MKKERPRRNWFLLQSIVILISVPVLSNANELVVLSEQGIAVGWSVGVLDLRDVDGNYEVIPVAYRLGYDPKGLMDRYLDLSLPGEVTLALEPFVGLGSTPSNEFEVGWAAMIQYSFYPKESNKRIHPYLDMGAGFIYTTVDWDDSTQYNLLLQAGTGINVRLSDQENKLTMGIRMRHYSNAGLDDRNKGINNIHFFLGITWKCFP